MNSLNASLRRTLGELWRGGYGEEVRRAAIIAPVLLLAGAVSAWFFPQVAENILRFFTQAVDLDALTSADAKNVATALFLNNVTAAFSAILWGLVPFAYLSVFSLGFNFFVVGAVGAYYVHGGTSLAAYLAGILPHGVVELPTLVLFCAAGLYLCSCTTARVRGNKDIRLIPVLAQISTLFLWVILPLLALAALIEAYVTPQLLSLVA